ILSIDIRKTRKKVRYLMSDLFSEIICFAWMKIDLFCLVLTLEVIIRHPLHGRVISSLTILILKDDFCKSDIWASFCFESYPLESWMRDIPALIIDRRASCRE